MRTSSSCRRRGVASRLLEHLIQEAASRGYHRLSLETGAMPFFEPARTLYRKFGFEQCGPFSTYKEDRNSVFFTKLISPEPPNKALEPTPGSVTPRAIELKPK